MSIGQQRHIESLSVEDFIKHTNNEFIQYAACSIFRLGKINQEYVVLNRTSGIIFSSEFASQALETYKTEIIKNQSWA